MKVPFLTLSPIYEESAPISTRHSALLSRSAKRVGTLGDAAAFSFYPSKNLGTFGDGGAVATDDGDLAEQVRALRNYGRARSITTRVRGSNSRLDELQAALLMPCLRVLDEWNARRESIAARYMAGLAATELRLPSVQLANRCAPR